MKNYTDSDYAINKFSKGIVYRFTNEIVEITLERYLAENSQKTENDFSILKELSDEIYLEQVRDENKQTKKNTSLSLLEETDECSTESLEDEYFGALEKEEKYLEDIKKTSTVLACLTDIQRKRYLLHIKIGLTTRQISEIEQVNFQAVAKSISAAKKKINIFLKTMKMGRQNHP